MKIVYIVNPISGTNSKKSLRQIIEDKTRDRGISYEIFPSVADGNYSFLHDHIKEHRITDVVIAGGDGTVSQVIYSLKDSKVNFGIIPCGSGNGLAFSAGIPKQPAKALDIVFNGKARSTDGFYINGQFACMLAGLGFDAKVAHDFAKQSKRGLATYAKQVIKNFFSAQPYQFNITIRDKQFITEAFFISIANSNQFGNNFTIAPQASLSDGKLDIVIVTSQNKFSLLIETLKQVAGKNKIQSVSGHQQKAVLYFQAEAISIINKDLAPLHIDGEPVETIKKLDIQISKKCFRLIQPVSLSS